MTTHGHLLLTGAQGGAISSLMQSLGRHYVREVHRTYRRTGTRWEGRFTSAMIAQDRSLLTWYRYVELHPVRAGRVHHPGAYPWSSSPHHAVGDPETRVQDHAGYLALGATVPVRWHAYHALCTAGIEADALQAIRDHVHKGRVPGSL